MYWLVRSNRNVRLTPALLGPRRTSWGVNCRSNPTLGHPCRTDSSGYFTSYGTTNAAIETNTRRGPRDVSRILSADPSALSKPDSPLWGGIGEPHYWGEPLFGYYRSTDPWVLRRHAHLLADAGIDTLVFDTTNAATYPDVYLKLCEVFSAIRSEGGRTPQIAFMVNTNAEETANKHLE